MGLRAGLDRCGKSRPPSGFDPRTVQPVASRYTDYATRPTHLQGHRRKCGEGKMSPQFIFSLIFFLLWAEEGKIKK